MKVLKFGGSSVANATNIKRVIEIIRNEYLKSQNLVVVVSALSGVTDGLLRLGGLAAEGDQLFIAEWEAMLSQHLEAVTQLISEDRKILVADWITTEFNQLKQYLNGVMLLRQCSAQTYDLLMSFGERVSSYLVSEACMSAGMDCTFIDASQIIKTDANFGSAVVDFEATDQQLKAQVLSLSGLRLMGGFVGSTKTGMITTLGRGGSDYTAAIVGALLCADLIEIWTDVNGVLTADPRKVPKAFSLPQISYEEASELAHFGAKVIHPKTMRPARLKGIPILIKNTFEPQAAGTLICKEPELSRFKVKGISILSNIVLIGLKTDGGMTITEVIGKALQVLQQAGIEILLITQASAEPAASLAISLGQLDYCLEILQHAFRLELQTEQLLPITTKAQLSIIAIVGQQMKGLPGISGKVFASLGSQNINVVAIAQGSTEFNISVVISSLDEDSALQVLHEQFFGEQAAISSDSKAVISPNLNLFIVGLGLVGSELIRQIAQMSFSGTSQFLPKINVISIANSKRMLINPEGINLLNWQTDLLSGSSTNIDNLFKYIQTSNLPNKILVDCTAGTEIPAKYEQLLAQGISIVTPNKKANSATYEQYEKLRTVAFDAGAKFRYETNVGAALPVLHMIKNLVHGGDKLVAVEAVLSGTLSYIFNNFGQSNKTFSQIVQEAQDLGYTEPDPRDDLNGLDFARKLLIIAREFGYKLELDNIEIEPLLTPECQRANSIEEFYRQLTHNDQYWEAKRNQARMDANVWRYVGTLDANGASLKLVKVGSDSPFYSLNGSDNLVAFTTDHYQQSPLVIKGSGAGAKVTAAGILADIFSIYN